MDLTLQNDTDNQQEIQCLRYITSKPTRWCKVYRGLDSRPGQAKYIKTFICCFSAKDTPFWRKSKDRLVLIQYYILVVWYVFLWTVISYASWLKYVSECLYSTKGLFIRSFINMPSFWICMTYLPLNYKPHSFNQLIFFTSAKEKQNKTKNKNLLNQY